MVSTPSGENPPTGNAGSSAPKAGKAPTALDLIRLSPVQVFPPGGEALYRQIALITELSADQVVLEAPSGRGIGPEFLSRITGAECHGVDPNPQLVQQATERVRASGAAGEVRYEASSLEDLPYRDEIFDVAIGAVGVRAADSRPEDPPAGVLVTGRLMDAVWAAQQATADGQQCRTDAGDGHRIVTCAGQATGGSASIGTMNDGTMYGGSVEPTQVRRSVIVAFMPGSNTT